MSIIRRIFSICGNSLPDSANKKIIQNITQKGSFDLEIFDKFLCLPLFSPVLEKGSPNEVVQSFQNIINEDQVVE